MRPLIAIDICNTLADVIKVLEEALGPRPDASRYEVPGATKQFFRDNPWVFARAPVIAGAKEGVELLANAGNIIYLTARPDWAKSITRDWLQQNGFPEAPIITTTQKAAVARQLNVDLAVDDAPHEIETLSRYCPVLVHARPYNTGYPGRFTWDSQNLLTATIELMTAPLTAGRPLRVIG